MWLIVNRTISTQTDWTYLQFTWFHSFPSLHQREGLACVCSKPSWWRRPEVKWSLISQDDVRKGPDGQRFANAPCIVGPTRGKGRSPTLLSKSSSTEAPHRVQPSKSNQRLIDRLGRLVQDVEAVVSGFGIEMQSGRLGDVFLEKQGGGGRSRSGDETPRADKRRSRDRMMSSVGKIPGSNSRCNKGVGFQVRVKEKEKVGQSDVG